MSNFKKKFQAERSVSHPSTNALCGERLTLSGGRADFFSAEKTPKMQLSSPGNEQVAYTTITRWLTESCRPLITQQRHGRRRHQAESTGNSCACVSHFYIWPFVLDTCHFQLTESIAFLLFFFPRSEAQASSELLPASRIHSSSPIHCRNGHVMAAIQRTRSIPLFIYFGFDCWLDQSRPHLHLIISATIDLTNYPADWINLSITWFTFLNESCLWNKLPE